MGGTGSARNKKIKKTVRNCEGRKRKRRRNTDKVEQFNKNITFYVDHYVS